MIASCRAVRLLELVHRKRAALAGDDGDVSPTTTDDSEGDSAPLADIVVDGDEQLAAYDDVLCSLTHLVDVALYESRSHSPVMTLGARAGDD